MVNGPDFATRNAELGSLRKALHDGRIDRREFLIKAAALGVGASAAAAMSRVYGAAAAPAARTSTIARNQDATPTAGGTLRFGRHSDSDNLDPVTNDGNVNIWVFMNAYDQLIKVTDDGSALEAGLAEKWEISDDGLTYTFHLR